MTTLWIRSVADGHGQRGTGQRNALRDNRFSQSFQGYDPRHSGKIMYPLDEILLLTLLAVLAGADSFVDIVRFGGKKLGIVAIPKPLDLLAIEGAIVTIDALGCQCPIARKIVEKKADYSFGLKGNQGSLREDEELLVSEQKARNFAMVPMRSSRVMTIKAASRPNRKGL